MKNLLFQALVKRWAGVFTGNHSRAEQRILELAYAILLVPVNQIANSINTIKSKTSRVLHNAYPSTDWFHQYLEHWIGIAPLISEGAKALPLQ